MHQHEDEILEAIWNAEEQGTPTLEAVKAQCPEKIEDVDLVTLQNEELLKLKEDVLVLTEAGRQAARNLIRRHRLAAMLLFTVLDLDHERREAIACEVEHTLVAEMADGICTLLGHPREGPDGKPIPPGDCCKSEHQTVGQLATCLHELSPGDKARVLYIKTRAQKRLQRLTRFGLTPGVELQVHQKTPAFTISYEGTELALDADVAKDIHVSPITENKENSTAQKNTTKKRGLKHLLNRE